MQDNSNKIFRNGQLRVKILPLILTISITSIFIWFALTGKVSYTTSLYVVIAAVLLGFLLSLYQIGRWKTHMIQKAENPKEVLERARAGFLKPAWIETIALMSFDKRKWFEEEYIRRTSEIRSKTLKTAQSNFDHDDVITAHQDTSPGIRLLFFELFVILGLVLIFIYQDERSIRFISAILFALALVGFYFTIKSIREKMRVVLEISARGLRVRSAFFPWNEIKEIDVVKGNTLVYNTFSSNHDLKVDQLSVPVKNLDEAVLFFSSLSKNNSDS